MYPRTLRFLAIAALSLGMAASLSPGRVHAQERIDADFKGAVGLGLVGAELGAVIPALAGLNDTWAYIVFPAVGAAGGAVAGYFAIDNAGHAEASVAVLTAGMALVIPALVVTLWATAYDPDDRPSAAVSPHTLHSGLRVRALSPAERHRAAVARAGTGAVRLADGELALATPGVALVPAVERGEVHVTGLNVSLLSGRF